MSTTQLIYGGLSASTISGGTLYGDGSNLTGIGGSADRTFIDINVNGNYNGDILKAGSGTTISGYTYYLETDNIWYPTNASAVTTSNGFLGVAIGTNPSSDGMLLFGVINNSNYTGTTGSPMYLTTTNGLLSEYPPSGIGYVIRVVGYKLGNTNSIIFKPDPTWIELT